MFIGVLVSSCFVSICNPYLYCTCQTHKFADGGQNPKDTRGKLSCISQGNKGEPSQI